MLWPLLLHFHGSRTQAQQLGHMDLVVLWHVGYSQTRIFPNLCLLRWPVDSLPLSHHGSPTRKKIYIFYLFFFVCVCQYLCFIHTKVLDYILAHLKHVIPPLTVIDEMALGNKCPDIYFKIIYLGHMYAKKSAWICGWILIFL